MEQTLHEEKLAKAIEYLRSRGKYVLDEDCAFTPTPYTEKVDIVKKYGEEGSRVNGHS